MQKLQSSAQNRVVPSLNRSSFIFVQLGVNTIRELCPISMETALPTRGVPAEEPVLSAVWAEAIAPFALAVAGARPLQVQVPN